MDGQFYPSATGVLYIALHNHPSPAQRCRAPASGRAVWSYYSVQCTGRRGLAVAPHSPWPQPDAGHLFGRGDG
jgi:hypothetical protein